MSTYNRLDLQTLGYQLVMPKNLPDHWCCIKDGFKEQRKSAGPSLWPCKSIEFINLGPIVPSIETYVHPPVVHPSLSLLSACWDDFPSRTRLQAFIHPQTRSSFSCSSLPPLPLMSVCCLSSFSSGSRRLFKVGRRLALELCFLLSRKIRASKCSAIASGFRP